MKYRSRFDDHVMCYNAAKVPEASHGWVVWFSTFRLSPTSSSCMDTYCQPHDVLQRHAGRPAQYPHLLAQAGNEEEREKSFSEQRVVGSGRNRAKFYCCQLIAYSFSFQQYLEQRQNNDSELLHETSPNDPRFVVDANWFTQNNTKT